MPRLCKAFLLALTVGHTCDVTPRLREDNEVPSVPRVEKLHVVFFTDIFIKIIISRSTEAVYLKRGWHANKLTRKQRK